MAVGAVLLVVPVTYWVSSMWWLPAVAQREAAKLGLQAEAGSAVSWYPGGFRFAELSVKFGSCAAQVGLLAGNVAPTSIGAEQLLLRSLKATDATLTCSPVSGMVVAPETPGTRATAATVETRVQLAHVSATGLTFESPTSEPLDVTSMPEAPSGSVEVEHASVSLDEARRGALQLLGPLQLSLDQVRWEGGGLAGLSLGSVAVSGGVAVVDQGRQVTPGVNLNVSTVRPLEGVTSKPIPDILFDVSSAAYQGPNATWQGVSVTGGLSVDFGRLGPKSWLTARADVVGTEGLRCDSFVVHFAPLASRAHGAVVEDAPLLVTANAGATRCVTRAKNDDVSEVWRLTKPELQLSGVPVSGTAPGRMPWTAKLNVERDSAPWNLEGLLQAAGTFSPASASATSLSPTSLSPATPGSAPISVESATFEGQARRTTQDAGMATLSAQFTGALSFDESKPSSFSGNVNLRGPDAGVVLSSIDTREMPDWLIAKFDDFPFQGTTRFVQSGETLQLSELQVTRGAIEVNGHMRLQTAKEPAGAFLVTYSGLRLGVELHEGAARFTPNPKEDWLGTPPEKDAHTKSPEDQELSPPAGAAAGQSLPDSLPRWF